MTRSALRLVPHGHANGPRRGVVLVVVMVVVVMLTLGALALSHWMLAERHTADLSTRHKQTRMFAYSGVEAFRSYMMYDEESRLQYGGHYDNAEQFAGVTVLEGAAPHKTGGFTILAPRWAKDGRAVDGVRYGTEDESACIHLNVLIERENQSPGAGKDILMLLPGMDDAIADAILDWMDADDEPRELGAEADVYAMLETPYAPRNGPIQSIDELLLVQGVTPELLYGADLNRNWRIDSGEPEPTMLIDNVDNSDGGMNRGWAAYLTLHSMEPTTSPDGTTKINLNQDDLQALQTELSEILDTGQVNFILAYRQFGPSTSTEGDLVAADSVTINTGTEAGTQIASVLDLYDVEVSGEFGGGGSDEERRMESPFTSGSIADTLPALLDACATSDTPPPGRINVYQAPRVVLLSIPDITEQAVDAILAARVEDPVERQDDMVSLAWLATRDILTVEEMKAIMPNICGDGAVHRLQVVGFLQSGGRASRLDVLIDVSQMPPAVLRTRELDALGAGYTMDMLLGQADAAEDAYLE